MMIIKNKIGATKPKKNKTRIVKISAQSMAEKARKREGNKSNVRRVRQSERKNFLGGIIALAVTAIVMAVVYIYTEGQAQAETGNWNQSRMQIIYDLSNRVASYGKTQIISDVLRASGMEDDVCLAVAQTIVEESNKTDIPIEMYLAIIKKESNFRSKARSSAHAKGIMQIQPGTWDAYVNKHNLPVTRENIFEPQANIIVASVILKELYDYYAKKGYEESEIWNYVLAAYYAGPASLKSGIKGYHWKYIDQVKQNYSDFETQIGT